MKFSVNSPILFIIVGAIIALVLGQSIYFLVKAIKRAKELGIASSTISKTISSSAVFTIAPAIAVLVGIVALSQSLGLALPWLRLSVHCRCLGYDHRYCGRSCAGTLPYKENSKRRFQNWNE